jgi:hypothetical protein
MPRFLIETQHGDDHEGCVRSLDAITTYGSHLVTHTEFGCEDGVHFGWLIVDVDSHEEAKQLVPPQYRSRARIVRLRKWSKEQIEEMVRGLEA